MTARFGLNRNQNDLNRSLRNLSTGRKINSGKDGPAALIAAERLSAEIKALEAESRTIERLNSNATVTDGHTAQLSSLMGELKGLVVSSANSGAMSDGEIAANQLQIDSIVSSIERITGGAISSLDRVNLPDGGNAAVESQLAAARTSVQSLKSGAANSLSSGNFEAALNAIDSAQTGVNTARGTVGAYQKNTLQPQLRSNEVAVINLTESRSRIVDTDFAVETSNLARAKTLSAASIKVLKIAQDQAGSILDLLA